MDIVFRRTVILLVIFFGALLSIIAIAGWIKVESGITKVTSGLWLNCLKLRDNQMIVEPSMCLRLKTVN